MIPKRGSLGLPGAAQEYVISTVYYRCPSIYMFRAYQSPASGTGCAGGGGSIAVTDCSKVRAARNDAGCRVMR